MAAGRGPCPEYLSRSSCCQSAWSPNVLSRVLSLARNARTLATWWWRGQVLSFPSGSKGAFVLMNTGPGLHFLNPK